MCEMIQVKKEISSTFYILDTDKFKDSLKSEMALLALDRQNLMSVRMAGTTVTDHKEGDVWKIGTAFMKTELYSILSNKALRRQYLQRLQDMKALLEYEDEVTIKGEKYKLHSIPPPTEKKPSGGTWSYYYGGYEPDGSNVRYETQKNLLDKYTQPIPIQYAIRTEKETTASRRDEVMAQFLTKVNRMRNVARTVENALKDVENDDGDEVIIDEKIEKVLCARPLYYYNDLGDATSRKGYAPLETINTGTMRKSIHPTTVWLKKDMGALSLKFPSIAMTAKQNTQFNTQYWSRDAMIGIVSSFIGQENFIILCSAREERAPKPNERYVAVYMDLLGNLGIGQVVGDPNAFIKNANSAESLRSLTERQAMQVCFSSFVPVKYETKITVSGSLEIPKTQSAAAVSYAKRTSINARAVLMSLPNGVTISDKYIIDPQSGTTIPLISEQKALYLKDAIERQNSMNMAFSQIEEGPQQMPLITEIDEEDDGTKMIEEKD